MIGLEESEQQAGEPREHWKTNERARGGTSGAEAAKYQPGRLLAYKYHNFLTLGC